MPNSPAPFDPEKVDRTHVRCMDGFQDKTEGDEVVRSSDYDSLLDLYRALKAKSVEVNRPWSEFRESLVCNGLECVICGVRNGYHTLGCPDYKKDLYSAGKSNTEAS